ncbi:hypothetical protein BDW62DRAFT_182330 [Aspergillus aurantiobrunneus]
MSFNHSAQVPPGPKTRYAEGLQLRALNVEKGAERFPLANDVSPPRISHWRCNLTALSQRRNLLFVACSNQIYVWEPAGASQTLGSKPEMIITPVMKEPRAQGYIQPVSPHEINSILVDDLGREEVLLLVTDSGNVCGYRVEAIVSALEKAAVDGKTRPLDGSEVDPFFIEYVGASAWGLAIHKFARLIAVSANTGLVTVFAFALVNSTSNKGDDAFNQLEEDNEFIEYGQTWLHIRTQDQFKQLQRLMPEKHRTRNIRLTYTGHFTNIPSVAFLNSDFDPNGVWMVSTDIDNKMLVWKVWESLGPFNLYQLSKVTFGTSADTLHWDDDRGWSVIALDPRTFHLLKSEDEACGGQPQRRVKDKQKVLDLTNISENLPDVSRLYNYFPPAVKAEPEETVLPDFFGADCLVNGGSDTQEKRDIRAAQSSADTRTSRPADCADAFSQQAVAGSFHADNTSEDGSSDTDMDPEDQQDAENHELLQALVDPTNIRPPHHRRPPGHGPLTTPEFIQFTLLETLGGEVHEAQALLGENLAHGSDDDEDILNQEMEYSYNDPISSEGTPEEEEAAYQIFDPPAISNFPILHFSHTDIHLIPHPFAITSSVVCGAPLFQRFTYPVVSLRGIDRLNMVKYIPEHGIVVAVSQKGRAAIIALTESRTAGRSFRVDWIVPHESQEKYGERPLVPLLGMSVSPMQGFEMPPDVPYVPRDSGGDDDDKNISRLLFQYTNSTNNTSLSPSSTPGNATTNDEEEDDEDEDDTTTTPGPEQSEPEPEPNNPLTLPECHARATRAYQPQESWRGWNPSRRYRLLLMYADHTVMSYEFWYTWNFSPSGESVDAAGGDGVVGSEDEYLIL